MSKYPLIGTLAGASIEDSDQTAHLCRLIRVFNVCSIGRPRVKLKLWSDFVDALIDLNFNFMHMLICT